MSEAQGAAVSEARDAPPTTPEPQGPEAPAGETTPMPAVPAPPPAPPGPAPSRTSHAAPPKPRLWRRRWLRRTLAVLLVLLLVAATGLAVYLYLSAQAWRDRSESYLDTSLGLGEDLATTRGELTGARAELDAVREQLGTAQARIVELADEKAQLGDEWEIQQQVVDYQARVSEAAGQVALALDECVQGQQELIGYLQAMSEQRADEDDETDAPPYDPAEVERFSADLDALCQAATEANIALQRELAR